MSAEELQMFQEIIKALRALSESQRELLEAVKLIAQGGRLP